MADLTFRYAALTDTGLRRSNNQDSGYASDRLLVIADGMGGAAAGDLASSETLAEIRALDTELDTDALTALRQAVNRANQRLGRLIDEDPAVEGMGTTLEAMVWDGDKLAVAHIGDSRAYRLRDGRLTQISTDHTFVQSLVEEGKITADEARTHPHRSLLLKAILGRDDLEPDFSWLQPALGDRYLLCSDGLTDMVAPEEIERSMMLENVDVAAADLVRKALEGGGYDNVTVVVAEFVAADDAIDPDLSCANDQPQLVGAAAEQPRPRTGLAGPPTTAAPVVDPEELRYAPVEPGRRRWIGWLLGTIVILGLLGGAGAYAYDWSQKQFYVAESDGNVAIFRGVDASVPGLTLTEVDEVTDITLDSLPAYQRERVRDGITANSRADAERIVANLDSQVTTPTPTPTPTSTATPSASATPTADTP